MGYPVLVRPSFVLSGAAMRVASSWTELSNFLKQVAATALEGPIVDESDSLPLGEILGLLSTSVGGTMLGTSVGV